MDGSRQSEVRGGLWIGEKEHANISETRRRIDLATFQVLALTNPAIRDVYLVANIRTQMAKQGLLTNFF